MGMGRVLSVDVFGQIKRIVIPSPLRASSSDSYAISLKESFLPCNDGPVRKASKIIAVNRHFAGIQRRQRLRLIFSA